MYVPQNDTNKNVRSTSIKKKAQSTEKLKKITALRIWSEKKKLSVLIVQK